MTHGKVRTYIAMSFDGFIAGPDDDLSWLGEPPETLPEQGVHFDGFIAQMGAMLMGRRTFDVVLGFGGPWPYGDLPILVATHRDLPEHAPTTAQSASGSIDVLLDQALKLAEGKDIYVDGGEMIRQVVTARRLDEAIVTVFPTLLGKGHALFAGLEAYHTMQFAGNVPYGRAMQMTLRPE